MISQKKAHPAHPLRSIPRLRDFLSISSNEPRLPLIYIAERSSSAQVEHSSAVAMTVIVVDGGETEVQRVADDGVG
jgi:hypothetical protein